MAAKGPGVDPAVRGLSAVALTRQGYSRSWCMRMVPYMALSSSTTTRGTIEWRWRTLAMQTVTAAGEHHLLRVQAT